TKSTLKCTKPEHKPTVRHAIGFGITDLAGDAKSGVPCDSHSWADGAKVKVSLEVEAKTDGGFTQQTVRTVSENCRTLRVRNSGFE
ncbi:MAG: hypothetical protein LBU58_04540, partial [Clostridiales bacterium]|nr:hypothetical protein [Clostridiales bacterium]